jgi:regulator of nonsense transcripts 3
MKKTYILFFFQVIIRRLPPTMTEEVFLEQISPLPDNDFFYFVKGEQQFGVPTFSRAYINFLNLEEIFTFQDKFDGYVFLDQKGTEYPAVVEFAPYQRIPRHQEPGAKEDKCNTIDNDPHYLEFLKKLEQPDEIVLQSAETYLEQLELREREIKGIFLNFCLLFKTLNQNYCCCSKWTCQSYYTVS